VPRDRHIVTLTQQLLATRDPDKTLHLSKELIEAIRDRRDDICNPLPETGSSEENGETSGSN
jgi:hypothetical protein